MPLGVGLPHPIEESPDQGRAHRRPCSCGEDVVVTVRGPVADQRAKSRRSVSSHHPVPLTSHARPPVAGPRSAPAACPTGAPAGGVGHACLVCPRGPLDAAAMGGTRASARVPRGPTTLGAPRTAGGPAARASSASRRPRPVLGPPPRSAPEAPAVDVHQDPQEVGENRMRDRSLADRVPLGAGPQVARDRGPAPPCLQRG